MLSRVADALYWMARNIERSESHSRIMHVHLTQMLEAGNKDIFQEEDYHILFEVCATAEELQQLHEMGKTRVEDLICFLTFGETNLNSSLNCIRIARDNARVTRDYIPNDLFEAWNQFYLSANPLQDRPYSIHTMRDFFNETKQASYMAQGIIEAAMSRDVAYYMLKIGKWLERAEKTARILNVVSEQTRHREKEYEASDYYYWSSALRMVNGYEAYLKSNPPRMEPTKILSFLITNQDFPRSIRYCMEHVREAVDALENAKVAHYSVELYEAMDSLRREFNQMKIQDLDTDETIDFLNKFQDKCNQIGHIFSRTYYLTEPVNSPDFSQHQEQSLPPEMRRKTAMKYKIEHTNIFDYDTVVDQSMNSIRLKPRSDECQRLLSYRTDITPMSLTKEHTDIWGNNVETFFIAERHQHLEIKSTSVVSIQRSPFIQQIDYSPEMKDIFHSDLFQEHYAGYLANTAYTYLNAEQMDRVDSSIGLMTNPVQYAIDVMRYVYDTFSYDPHATDVTTKATDSFEIRGGVCQDMAHVMLGILRTKQIPARYVSGYLYVGEDSALVGDAASHAWVEVMIPGIGWVGLDPTNNVEALENHIRMCVGRDYNDVSPVQGVYRGGASTIDVKVSVSLLSKSDS